MTVFKYGAVRIRQTTEGQWLVLFAAPAQEIDAWAGVPQKKRIASEDEATETIGFQREVNPKRLESLKCFYQNEKNVIQNPLLCATRASAETAITFAPQVIVDPGMCETGIITIQVIGVNYIDRRSDSSQIQTSLGTVASFKIELLAPRKLTSSRLFRGSICLFPFCAAKFPKSTSSFAVAPAPGLSNSLRELRLIFCPRIDNLSIVHVTP